METQTPFRVLSRPLEEARNLWRDDPMLQALVKRLVKSDRAREWLLPQLERMGAEVPGRVDALARDADRFPPIHRPFDRFGNRVDQIELHPSYRAMEQIAYGSGLVALKYESEVRTLAPASSQVLGFALSYLFAQGESGLFCPVCMTDGAARVVERLGTDAQRARLLPRLVARDVSRLMRGAMFLTEKQGGSDVGALETRAVSEGGGFRLHGEKWFCSNVDAEVILTLARPEGAPAGTRGLGLFLLHPTLPDGARNGLRIERIKDKLGVRSMATGEVTLDGARAEAVGPLDRGFKSMTEMINLSRLYNAFASVAIARRAIDESTRYLRARRVFGRQGIEQPLARELLADLNAEEVAAKHLVFQTAEHLDRADAGGALDARRVRLLTPLIKYTTAKLAVWAASEGIELHGGNGYIEDFLMPRLLRDAQVLPVWEGTTDVLVLDALRACQKGAAHELLLADVQKRCEGAPATLSAEAGAVSRTASELARQAAQVGRADLQGTARALRRWTDQLTTVYATSLLFESARGTGPAAAIASAAARRLVQRHLEPALELGADALAALCDATVRATDERFV